MKRRSPNAGLAAIVVASFAVRVWTAFLRPTPDLFPDEYTYAAIGRSLAETGRPLVRGSASHFPALLQPLLTAPAWLLGDIEVGYRVVQGMGALAMSLAAIPAYLLARRLRLGTGLSLGVAALTVLAPDLVYASYVASEPFAYPLVLTAVLAAVSALARPSLRSQLVFVALAALCAFTRVQFLVLPLVFVTATMLLGLREQRLRSALREQLVPLMLLLVPVVALLGVRGSVLGNYDAGAGAFSLHPLATLRWLGLDAMTLAYACGWVLVPGALLGASLALRTPRVREELALVAFALPLAGALLLEAGLVQSGVQRIEAIEERYVFYLIPLIGLFFASHARRGWPHPIALLALAGALLLVSVRLPLSGYTVAYGSSASPLLSAVTWLVRHLGEQGSASLVVAIVAALLLLAAVACSRRPRLGTPIALVLALAATGAASAGAIASDARSTTAARDALLPAEPSWVDRSGLHDVALVQGAGGDKWSALEQLFWNRSVDRVLLLPGAAPFDAFATESLRVGDDGSLLADGAPYVGNLLVDGYGSFVRLRGAHPVASAPTHTLWASDGRPRLSLYAVGRYHDGWLAGRGAVYLWPASAGGRLAGHLKLSVRAPADAGRVFDLRFEAPGGKVSHTRLSAGERRTVSIPVCSGEPAYVTFSSDLTAFAGLRVVSVRSSPPAFVADEAACPVIVRPLA